MDEKKRVEYGKLTVKELQKLLKEFHARTTGEKADLIDRLIFFESNKHLQDGSDDINQQKQRIKTPPMLEYKDLHAACPRPDFTKGDLDRFLERYGKKKGESVKMYARGYLVAIRFVQLGVAYYVKGRCDASRKKGVQYEVDVCLSMKGDVGGSSCECAAGWSVEGHCKHIIILLLALLDICTKETVILNETCTEKLQAFHKPSKKFFKSPQQAKQLMQRRMVPVKLFHEDQPSADDPPSSILDHHPFEMSEEYKLKWIERSRNILINNGYNMYMSMKMTIPPANIYGVALDHTYSNFDLIEDVLESLQLIGVTPEDVAQIEFETRGQSHNYLWHWYRSHRMSASMFSRIYHVTKEGAPKLVDDILNPKFIYSKPTEHGKKYESTAVKAWNHRNCGSLDLTECGLFIHPRYPEICGTPDRLNAQVSVLEVKCPYRARDYFIDDNSVPSLIPYLERNRQGGWSLKTESPYYFQVQGQLFVTQRLFCDFIVWTFKDLVHVSIERDDEFIEDMVRKLIAFDETYLKPAILVKYLFKNSEKFI